MRYTPAHKTETRQRIVDAAADLFRRDGYDGVGIDRIMSAAGLTRGGFYAHFDSKSALFAAILQDNHDFCRRMRARDGTSPDELNRQAVALAAQYLHPANKEAVGAGCSMAALAGDVSRQGLAAQKAFADALETLAGEFSKGLSGAHQYDSRALAAMALCVGGLSLSRAAGDTAIADQMLTACSEEVARLLNRTSASG